MQSVFPVSFSPFDPPGCRWIYRGNIANDCRQVIAGRCPPDYRQQFSGASQTGGNFFLPPCVVTGLLFGGGELGNDRGQNDTHHGPPLIPV